MDEFLILLQAKLDEVTLDKNVKGKLDQLKKDFSELKIMPVIDPQALSNIVKQLESITGKKITIPNIEFNTGQAVKDVQQLGKQITDSFNQSTKQISLEKEINKQVNSLMESFGIHGKNAFNEIKNALIEYRQELLNTTSSTKAFDDIFDLFADNSSSIDKVTSAIANNMKVANDAKSVYQSLVDYIAQTNKSGSKIYIPNSIKSEYGQDFNSMRSILGSAFTSDTKYKNSLDFENFVTELNSQLGNVIDMSHGAEAAFSDLVNKVKSTKGRNYLSADELFGMGYLNKSEMISQIDSCIDSINQSEKELAQQSSVATDKVVQNENRKQQAIQQTANVQRQLKENGNIIQQTDFTTSFNTKDEAEIYFNTLSKIVHIQEKLGENKNLNSFIVEVKNAEGAVEKLTYKYNELTSAFEYSGGSINNNGVQKQIDAIKIKASRLQDTFDSLKSKYSDLNASNPIKEQTHITELENQYKKVEQAIEAVKASDSATFSSMVSNAESEIKTLQRMGEEFKRAETISMRMNGSDISSGLAQAQERFQKLKANSAGFEQMTETIQKLDAAIATVGDKSSLKTFVDQLKVAEAQLNRVKAETNSMSQVNKIQLSMGDGTYESKVDALVAKTMQWTDVNGNARISTNELSNAFDQLTTASNNYANSPTEAHQKALIASEKELDNQIKTVTNSVKSMNAELAKDSKISSLHNQLADFMGKNGKAVKYFGNDLRDIFNQTGQGAKLTNQELAVLKQRFIDIQNTACNTGKLGKTWFQTLREGMSSFSYWTSSTFLVMKSIQKIKEAVTFSKELNSALVNINYTMDVTASQLENIGSKSIEMAKDLHTSAENVLGAVKLYANAKETADSILAKAQPAIMLSNVTGFSGEESAKYLQTIMNQFDLTQDNLMNISDTIQGISQSMAHDFADGIVQINEGIATSGEIARAAGMELADYASMIGLLVEKTGLGGSQLGNSLKTIITRTTKAGKIMGIDEGEISAAETSLRSIGVEVRKTDGEFNAFNDTMSELAKHWDSLSDVEKSNISFNLAGTRQINVIQTLLRNWDEYEDLVNKANNSTGVTFENQEKYAESLEGKLKELSATTTSIGDNIFKSDDLSVIVSGLTKIAGLFDTITSKTKLLGSIGLGAGIFAGVKNIGKCRMSVRISNHCYCFEYALHA